MPGTDIVPKTKCSVALLLLLLLLLLSSSLSVGLGIYQTNHIFRACNVEAILYLQFMVHAMLFSSDNIYYYYYYYHHHHHLYAEYLHLHT